MTKKPLIILTGPTAVGKTDLSIKLAKTINGEIISADSMQVYKNMDIGTAKIKQEEMSGIPHHLINILEPTEEFNVFLFQKYAKNALNLIYNKGKIPIIVGGTGFYIQALLYDIEFNDEPGDVNNNSYRNELYNYYKENGAIKLHDMLNEIDPVSAGIIHVNNIKRVIRALEFYHEHGYPISRHNEEQHKKDSPYNFAYFVLNQNRDILYKRIEKRIDIMISDGLVNEVKTLLDNGCTPDMVSMQGLGYKEMIPYINGDYSLEDAINILKRDTRHFAKRQLTWFRREKDIIWVDKDELPEINDQIKYILIKLNEKNIIN